MATNSSDTSSTSAFSSALSPLQQAEEAGREFSTLWSCRQHANLLQSTPPDAAAASSGLAAQAMQTSLLLLHKLNAALSGVQSFLTPAAKSATKFHAKHLLHALITELHVPQLLAQLLLWLQQRPECLCTTKPAAAAAATRAAVVCWSSGGFSIHANDCRKD